MLTKKYLRFFDCNFSEIIPKKKNEFFKNFSKFSEIGLTLINQGDISINKIENDNICYIKEITDLKINCLVETKKYIVIDDIRYIFF